jgi:anti-sigma factor RsiW
MRCVEAERIIQTDGDRRASSRQRARLDRHLTTCSGCRQARAAHSSLLAALRSDQGRQISSGFEDRLTERLAAEAPAPLARAWWRRMEFLAAWRLRPALAATAGLAVALSAWALLPSRLAAPPPGIVSPVAITDYRATAPEETPEQELVEFSIAQSTHGSISETN